MEVYTRHRGNPTYESMIVICLLDKKNLFFSMKDNISIKKELSSKIHSYKMKLEFDI